MSPWRKDFPALAKHPDDIFFDNAATTQKPKLVIEQMNDDWQNGVWALNRSSSQLANQQAEKVEQSLQIIANFFGAKIGNLIITKSATEALTLLIYNFSLLLNKNEKVLLGISNHSSNLVGWQKHFQVEYLNFLENGTLDLNQLKELAIKEEIRVVSLNLVSNVFGHRENLKEISNIVKKANQKRKNRLYLVIDAAAAVSSTKINFFNSGVDFMIVSAHKMYGPFIASLIARNELLGMDNFLPNSWGGGNIILDQQNEWKLLPSQRRFFSGVTDVVSIMGWASACQWLQKDQSQQIVYLHNLTKILVTHLAKIKNLIILGQEPKTHLVTFYYEDYNYQDVLAYLGAHRVCARGGQHCAQLIYRQLKIEGAIRLSLSIYNNEAEVKKVIYLLSQLPQKIVSASFQN